MNADLLYERRGDIGWVTFNRPQARNALTFAMYEGLAAICAEANKTRDVKALVITGAGDKAFAAGTDIAQFKAFQGGEDGIGYERKMDHMLETIERCAVPTIAAIATHSGALAHSASVARMAVISSVPVMAMRLRVSNTRSSGLMVSMPIW